MKNSTDQQERQLAEAYREADKEMDHAWDVTVSDGLKDEDWSEPKTKKP